MSRKSAIFLTSALVSVGLVVNPLAAAAGSMSQIGTEKGNAALRAVLDCGGPTMGHPGPVGAPSGNMGGPHIFAPVTVQNSSLFGSVGGNNAINVQNNGGNTNVVNKPINVQTNIDNSKSINFNKPVTVTNNNTDIKNIDINKPVTVNKNIDASKRIDINKPVTVNNNINSVKNVEINKSVNIYKPITNIKNININKNIDNSKNININKNIDNSKNININKNVNININANTNINNNSNNNTVTNNNSNTNNNTTNTTTNTTTNVTDNSVSNSSSNSSSSSVSNGGNASAMADAIANGGSVNGGDFSVNVVGSVAASAGAAAGAGADAGAGAGAVDAGVVDYVARGGQCSYVDATVVKAIHAICVSADHREFPASHMVGTSWIESGYEGEVARCLPGSTLKVMIGAVVQSDQGMATTMNGAQTLSCGVREAVRHYKDGMLKCAPAVKVVDCTERTNLRKWGTGDMFFSYTAKVCLEQKLVGGRSRETTGRQSYSQSSRYSYGSADRAITLRGQNMPGGY